MSKNHTNNQNQSKASEFLSAYFEENLPLLEKYLNSDNNDNVVGREIILSFAQKSENQYKFDGLSGSIFSDMCQKLPGGYEAACEVISQLIDNNKPTPLLLKNLHKKLISHELKPVRRSGRRATKTRRNILFMILLRVLQKYYGLNAYKNETNAHDNDLADAGIELIVNEYCKYFQTENLPKDKSLIKSINDLENKFFV